MRIQKIVSQHRRDFTAIYECEHCGRTRKGYGYDDHNFHNEVIPKMKCPSCEKTAGDTYQPLTPKYAPHEVV
jgi:ribosomal protein L37AE/L43A